MKHLNLFLFSISGILLAVLLFSPSIIEKRSYNTSESLTVNREQLNNNNAEKMPEKLQLIQKANYSLGQTAFDKEKILSLNTALDHFLEKADLKHESLIITRATPNIIKELVVWQVQFMSSTTDISGSFVYDESSEKILQLEYFGTHPYSNGNEKQLITIYLDYLKIETHQVKKTQQVTTIKLKNDYDIAFYIAPKVILLNFPQENDYLNE